MATSITAQSPFTPSGGKGVTLTDKPPGELDRDAFMKLLVAQLAHQDPLEPSDPSQFVAQLSQFTSLEQLVNMKDSMDLLSVTQTAGTSAQMVSFIGKDVRFDGSGVVWTDASQPVKTTYTLDKPSLDTTLQVIDDAGKVVDTIDLGTVPAGTHDLTFNGMKQDGTKLAAGTYHLRVTATDSNGDFITVKQTSVGEVTGVTFVGGYPQLMLADGRTIGLSQIYEVLSGDHADDGTAPVTPPVTDTTSPPLDSDETQSFDPEPEQ